MAYTVRHKNRILLFGLSWRTASQAIENAWQQRRQVTTLAREVQASHFVVCKGNQHTMFGFLARADEPWRLTRDRALQKHLRGADWQCAAMTLAMHTPPDAVSICILPLGNNTWSLIATSGRVPVLDLAGNDFGVLLEQAERYIKDLPKGTVIRGFGDASELFPDAEPCDLDTLVQNMPHHPDGVLRPVPANLVYPIVGVAGLAVLIGTAIIGWKTYKRHQLEQAELARQSSVDLIAQYRGAINSALQSPSAAPTALSDFVNRWDVVRNLPVSNGNWRIQGVECATLQCTVTWRRQKGGTYVTWKAVYRDEFSRVEMLPDGQSVRLVKSAKTAKPSALTLEQLPEWRDFLVQFGTLFQTAGDLGIQAKWTEPADTPNPPPAGWIDRTLRAGTWSATGDLGMLAPLLQQMPSNIRLSQFTIVAPAAEGSRATFNVSGQFFVANPAPTPRKEP